MDHHNRPGKGTAPLPRAGAIAEPAEKGRDKMKKSAGYILLLIALACAIGATGSWLGRRQSSSDPVPAAGRTVAEDDDEQEETVSDTFRPLYWFDGKADAYELFDWDVYGDVGATALYFYGLRDADAAEQIFQAYTDRLSEEDTLQEISREEYESDITGSNQVVCYTYTGREDVGTMTCLHTRTLCNMSVGLSLMKTGGGIIQLTWGDGMPIDIDPYDTDMRELPSSRGYSGDADESEPAPDNDVPVSQDDSGGETPASPSGGGSGTVDEYSACLPSLDDWLGGMRRNEDQASEGGRLISFKFDLDDKQAAFDYVELLQDDRFQLTLVATGEDDFIDTSAQIFYDYAFRYDGKADVDELEVWSLDGNMPDAPVSVSIELDYGKGTVLLSMQYANQFTFVDDGDRSAQFPSPAGGSSSGGSSGSDSSSGGHWEWQTVERDCPSCVGGTCPICHGTGTYRLYGQEVSCPRDCTACDGRGTITQQEYVYVSD